MLILARSPTYFEETHGTRGFFSWEIGNVGVVVWRNVTLHVSVPQELGIRRTCRAGRRIGLTASCIFREHKRGVTEQGGVVVWDALVSILLLQL